MTTLVVNSKITKIQDTINEYYIEIIPQDFISGKTSFTFRGLFKNDDEESIVYDFTTEHGYP